MPFAISYGNRQDCDARHCLGTDELAGLSGRFDIKIEDGQHSYDFEYTLPEVL